MEMPMQLRPLAKKVTQSVESPLMAMPAAALCSVLLLPCSSGPYVAALMILSSLSFWARLPYLVYYNVLFTLPMVLITLGVAFGTSPGKVMAWKDKHVRELHLLAGLLLIAVLFLV
jgi:cytochrome c-type biogenesis protein